MFRFSPLPMKALQNKLPIRYLAFIVGLQETRSIVGNFTPFDANAILAKRQDRAYRATGCGPQPSAPGFK